MWETIYFECNEGEGSQMVKTNEKNSFLIEVSAKKNSKKAKM